MGHLSHRHMLLIGLEPKPLRRPPYIVTDHSFVLNAIRHTTQEPAQVRYPSKTTGIPLQTPTTTDKIREV